VDPSSVEIVLVRPARPANVGAAGRAMKNMGLRVLKLVGPPGGLAGEEARRLAHGAEDVLNGATVWEDLGAAVAPSTLVVGTSGRPAPEAWTPRQMAEEAAALAGGGRVSLVFGPEATGLTREELALCHRRVHIPTDTAQPSLNLAQAVLLMAYEIRLSAIGLGREERMARASAGELEQALDELRHALLGIGYLNPDNPQAILAEIRILLARAGPTPREVALLRGLARQIGWAGRIARGQAASG
jgi:TrmH family RNA methyltransferase